MRRGDIWWVSLDPTVGGEIKKTRPCVVLTHDTLNRLRRTVVVVPLSSSAKAHPPITLPVTCQGEAAVAIVDQVRAVSKFRLKDPIGTLPSRELAALSEALSQILHLS
ncbi:MAG: type II toxin-antitoxin system PemK/MazF family toxin [Candidatus Omnitrophica bacterium]|nr:type II toxin-antitoxin system PemK/MazF family toxin [Candidatus Omnitrophota bacterium]